jgi:tetratricopeptide (TPR) repeat protein
MVESKGLEISTPLGKTSMGKKKSRRKAGKASKAESSLRLPSLDPRVMERTMSEIGKLLGEREFASAEEANAFMQDLLNSGGLPATPKLTALEQAQDLMYQAWETSGKQRVELARRALEVSPDCADGYVLLAEETARTLQEAKDLYEQAVKAGERALGPRAFKKDVGHFWGILETRPYMRARAGLAQCLWMLGERQQAIEHYTDMLRLNPNDNQGIRYKLASCLLEEDYDEALGRLLNQYKDDASAAWLYTRALWIFRRDGLSSEAAVSLKKALTQNPFVPAYLLGRKSLPRSLPGYIGVGDENEAIDYAADTIRAWQRTPGALEWLATCLLTRVK